MGLQADEQKGILAEQSNPKLDLEIKQEEWACEKASDGVPEGSRVIFYKFNVKREQMQCWMETFFADDRPPGSTADPLVTVICAHLTLDGALVVGRT